MGSKPVTELKEKVNRSDSTLGAGRGGGGDGGAYSVDHALLTEHRSYCS